MSEMKLRSSSTDGSNNINSEGDIISAISKLNNRMNEQFKKTRVEFAKAITDSTVKLTDDFKAELNRAISIHKSNVDSCLIAMNEKINENSVAILKSNEDKLKVLRLREIIIRGVPDLCSDKLISIITKIANSIGFSHNMAYVVDVLFRLNKKIKSNNKPIVNNGNAAKMSPILVRFTSQIMKNEFINKYYEKKNLSLGDLGYNSSERIFISENLSKENNQLLSMAIKLKKHNIIRKTKIVAGMIFVTWAGTVNLAKISNVNDLIRTDEIKKLIGYDTSLACGNIENINNNLSTGTYSSDAQRTNDLNTDCIDNNIDLNDTIC